MHLSATTSFRTVWKLLYAIVVLERYIVFLFLVDEELVTFAQEQQLSEDEVRQAVRHTLTDRNPDYGLRGCRITAFYPDITELQVKVNFRRARLFL